MRTRLIRLLRLLSAYKWHMLLAALLGFLTVGSGVGLMMTSAYIIARAALHPSVAELQVAIVGVRFFGISRGLFRYLERLVAHNVALRLLAQFRVWFFRAVEPLAPARLSHLKSGDLLARVVADVESLQNFYVRALAPPVIALLITLLMFVLYGAFSLSLALALVLAMMLASLGVPLWTLRAVRGLGARLVNLEAELSVMALDGVQGLADLTAFGRAEDHFARFGELHDEFIRLKRRQKMTLALHEALVGLMMNVAVLALFVDAVPMVRAGEISGVSLAALALGVMAAFEAVLPMPTAALNLEEIDHAAERLFEIIDTPAPPEPSRRMIPQECSISFRNVSFRYAPNDPAVLTDFSLQVPQGGRIVLVGRSGAGKSTLIHLLHRFWEIDAGEITIGGRSICDFSQAQLSELIAVAPQQVFLFSGTVRDNLLLAKPAAEEGEIAHVCGLAQLDDFIAGLPNGLETPIGEGGLRLSGGERRRLAIARALLKEAPIVIFDEPTADLDVETEAAIWRMIAELPAEKTVLVISHRLPKSAAFTIVKVEALNEAAGKG